MLGEPRLEAASVPESTRKLAIELAVGICLLSILGAVYAISGSPQAFNLDGEIVKDSFHVPVLFSTALLLGAFCLAIACERASQRAWPWYGLAAVFAFMALDELLTIHETLQSSAGANWQLLYAPLGLAGAVVWVAALREMWGSLLERVTWVGAALLWLISEVLEQLEYDSRNLPVHGAGAMANAEKVLQLTGTSMFVLALLLAYQRSARRRSFPDAVRGSSATNSTRFGTL